MPIFATAGAKIYIGGAVPAKTTDHVEADFDAQTWVEIKQAESIGSFGDTSQEITFDVISESRTRRVKGTRSAGTMEVVCGIDYADAGQLAAIAAEKTDNNYAIKIEFDDAPTGGTPSERYFIAIIGGASEQLDTANNVMKLNLSLWINSNVVRVNAAA
ncbi:MAG: hypothetical protein CML66_14685 [Rhodobacteraceae bacterium]|nr:hypothetical protein [Paracoccaceae bacterium]MAY47162.1 hypothetical protein [Paracoccaceae bacterium]|tara:strand:- start:176 stop:652 length:477 start_codon:yes stop_codon:yes gene_type:complete